MMIQKLNWESCNYKYFRFIKPIRRLSRPLQPQEGFCVVLADFKLQEFKNAKWRRTDCVVQNKVTCCHFWDAQMQKLSYHRHPPYLFFSFCVSHTDTLRVSHTFIFKHPWSDVTWMAATGVILYRRQPHEAQKVTAFVWKVDKVTDFHHFRPFITILFKMAWWLETEEMSEE